MPPLIRVPAETAGTSPGPQRVLYIVPNLKFGGAERQLLVLLGALDRRRYVPRLCCVEGLGPLAGEARALGVAPVVLGRAGRFDLRGILRLAMLVRRERPAIVHSWLYLANLYGRLGGRLGGAPVIIASERGMTTRTNPRRRQIIRTVDRLLAWLTDCIVVNSEAVRGYVRGEGIAVRKTALVYNGVPLGPPAGPEPVAALRAGLGLAPERPLVGMVARLDPEVKDFPTFLRAAALVRAARPDVAFVVVGDGPQRTALEALAADLALGPDLLFAGYRADARALQTAFDVAVLCSLSEGFSNVVLEAMAAGRPLVATDIPPNREAVRDGGEGLLVPPRDPEATAASILRLLDDPALAARLGAAARARVAREFSVEAMAGRMMALYDRLLARRA